MAPAAKIPVASFMFAWTVRHGDDVAEYGDRTRVCFAIHCCMRWLGHCIRAHEIANDYDKSRKAFGEARIIRSVLWRE